MTNSIDWRDDFAEELGDQCDGCGERFDPARPNAGDGWAEMAHPAQAGYLDADHFVGHYQCGLARGLELA